MENQIGTSKKSRDGGRGKEGGEAEVVAVLPVAAAAVGVEAEAALPVIVVVNLDISPTLVLIISLHIGGITCTYMYDLQNNRTVKKDHNT